MYPIPVECRKINRSVPEREIRVVIYELHIHFVTGRLQLIVYFNKAPKVDRVSFDNGQHTAHRYIGRHCLSLSQQRFEVDLDLFCWYVFSHLMGAGEYDDLFEVIFRCRVINHRSDFVM